MNDIGEYEATLIKTLTTEMAKVWKESRGDLKRELDAEFANVKARLDAQARLIVNVKHAISDLQDDTCENDKALGKVEELIEIFAQRDDEFKKSVEQVEAMHTSPG